MSLYKFIQTRSKNRVIENRVMENRVKRGITVYQNWSVIWETQDKKQTLWGKFVHLLIVNSLEQNFYSYTNTNYVIGYK